MDTFEPQLGLGLKVQGFIVSRYDIVQGGESEK